MNCHYCQQPITTVMSRSILGGVYENYMCEVCHVDYALELAPHQDAKLESKTIFAIKVKDKTYEVQFWIESQRTVIYYCRPMDVQAAGSTLYERQIVFTLNSIPDWTPFNIQKKLETLIIFS